MEKAIEDTHQNLKRERMTIEERLAKLEEGFKLLADVVDANTIAVKLLLEQFIGKQ